MKQDLWLWAGTGCLYYRYHLGHLVIIVCHRCDPHLKLHIWISRFMYCYPETRLLHSERLQGYVEFQMHSVLWSAKPSIKRGCNNFLLYQTPCLSPGSYSSGPEEVNLQCISVELLFSPCSRIPFFWFQILCALQKDVSARETMPRVEYLRQVLCEHEGKYLRLHHLHCNLRAYLGCTRLLPGIEQLLKTTWRNV